MIGVDFPSFNHRIRCHLQDNAVWTFYHALDICPHLISTMTHSSVLPGHENVGAHLRKNLIQILFIPGINKPASELIKVRS